MNEKRDFKGLAVALVLLAGSLAWFLWSSREQRERREATLATVPEFPRPNQPPAVHRAQPGVPVRPRPPLPAVARGADGGTPADPMSAFVLAKAPSAGLVSVNALLNTPLFDRLKECMPADFQKMEDAVRGLGIELERDVDRVGIVPGGMAMSGFFDGKPVAERMAGMNGQQADRHDYRGAQIFERSGQCMAQLGNYVFVGKQAGCEALVDRALTPPETAAAQDVYGDVWFHSDLTAAKGPVDPQLAPLFDAMKDVTLRANVWDSVALTLEGSPKSQRDAHELAAMARGAISVVKSQFDEEDVELKALADLAKVQPAGDKLLVDLAVPAKDLFDRLHLPCPGRADAGAAR